AKGERGAAVLRAPGAEVPQGNDWLSAAELATLAGMRVPARRRDWRLGRWAAKRALVAVLGDSVAVEVRAAGDGAPEPFVNGLPAPVSISISHRRDWEPAWWPARTALPVVTSSWSSPAMEPWPGTSSHRLSGRWSTAPGIRVATWLWRWCGRPKRAPSKPFGRACASTYVRLRSRSTPIWGPARRGGRLLCAAEE